MLKKYHASSNNKHKSLHPLLQDSKYYNLHAHPE